MSDKKLQYIITNCFTEKYLQILGDNFTWVDEQNSATRFEKEDVEFVKTFIDRFLNSDCVVFTAPLRFVLKKIEDDSILYYLNTFKQMDESYHICWTVSKDKAQQFDRDYATDMARALRLICGHHITSEQV